MTFTQVNQNAGNVNNDVLRWTDKVPTEPGWYWHTYGSPSGFAGGPRILEVYKNKIDGLIFGGMGTVPNGGQWAGPIPEPVE